MKPLVLALAFACAFTLAACSGDDGGATSTGPLTLEQRVVSEEDAPDSKPDPVETPATASTPEEFSTTFGDRFVNPQPEETAELESSSFVEAHGETRFIADTHSREAPHIFSLVLQFGNEADASRAAEIFHDDSIRPCPENCAQQAEEFDVADIPGAEGTHRFATEESVAATGDPNDIPFDEYEINFADGVFSYRISLREPPGEGSEDEAEEIAQRLYERVHGVPAA